ncbi:MAG TPA: FtsX-like permease family protein, partial [Polyangiaceae bacterium]|nr:FtsX-like permease family protein [Polyangiaceae bacterium]
LGVAALATVMSVTGGFQSQFREKVLGVNAHVLVLKYSSDFREYREVMRVAQSVPGVTAVAPFTINPMMVNHNERTATGVLVKGVDPELMTSVLDVPKHIIDPPLAPGAPPPKHIEGMRRPGAKPAARPDFVWPTLGLDLDDPPPPGASGSAAPPGASGSAAPPAASSAERDPEGRPLNLLKAIERELAAAEARRAAAAASARAPAGASPAAKVAGGEVDVLDPRAPRGNIEPEGGYKSRLPDDDEELPADILPDPCRDPAAVAAMPGAIIGVTLANDLGLKLGDCFQITSPTIGYSYSGSALRPPVAKRFRVVAVFEAGFQQYDAKLVYVDLYEAQAFYDTGDSVTGIEMKVEDIGAAKGIAREIDERLKNGIYHTMDWEELNHGLFTALRIQQILMSAVLALIIVVAAFTVVATLIMVVLDKKKEIAVLKAMGSTDDAILRIFLYQGGIIGVTGTTLGLGLGYGVCKGLMAYGFRLDPKVYFISRLPVDIRPVEFMLTGAIAVIICLLATVAPSLYASWLRPTEGFREVG